MVPKVVDEAVVPGLRVLLIDDDAAIARSVARLFRLHDIRVDHLGTVAQVEEFLSRPADAEGWDVILLDVNLPQMSGLDILRRLRANGTTAAVVMLPATTRRRRRPRRCAPARITTSSSRC